MPLEVDHAFIACATGAPEAKALLQLGFVEGSSNTHAGQGTANRRFFFDNFMLELLWVTDPAEAQSGQTRRTRLWDRCEQREAGASPLGIVFRGSEVPPGPQQAPFPTWSYTPSYLPAGVSIYVAEGTKLDEPELFYLPFLKRAATRNSEPVAHALPIRRICGLAVGILRFADLSEPSRRAQADGLLAYFESPRPVLEIIFEGPPDMKVDLRPELPLIFRGTSN
ncbi:MAG TPA: VOC family protein [Steroidobacteraceae bacterium]